MRDLQHNTAFNAGIFKRLLLGLLWLASLPTAWAQIAGAPFTCDVVFYQVRNPSTNFQIFGYPTINSGVTPTAIYPADKALQLNALGYNPADNYMYALRVGATPPELYRIGQSGYELVGTIADTTGAAIAGYTQPTAGAFDAGGRYYFAGQGTTNGLANSIAPNAIFRIDSIPALGNMVASHRYNFDVPSVLNTGDFDFNGAGGPNGLLLGASKQAEYGNIPTMHRITLQASSSTAIGTASVVTATLAGPPTGVGGFSVGSAFWDAAANGGVGRFYVFDNGASTFWQITNPEFGPPSATALSVPNPTLPGPNSYTTGTSDGTSCPISGTRRADLQIVKTDGLVTATVGQVTNYQITVTNNGPYPANYSVLRDPAAAGLQKLSVTCTAPGGPPSAICPAVLSVAALESPGGVQIITFPPGTQLVFSLNTLITAPLSQGVVTNTASITPAVDTIDGDLSNNTSTDSTTLANSTTSVITAASICPAGTVESLTNLVLNGSIASATPLLTGAALAADNTLATLVGPNANTLSRQQGARVYNPIVGRTFTVSQNPFPGDSTRSVIGSDWWMLSNGKTGAAAYNIWSQTVTGLVPGKVYEFMYYASNATLPVAGNTTVAPILQTQVDGVNAGASDTLAAETSLDQWRLIQRTFTAAATSATLGIQNVSPVSAGETGDLAAITQLTLRACEPAANIRVSKSNGVSFLTTGTTTNYTVTVSNPSAVTASTVLLTDPAVANFIKNSITCTPSGASLCPTPAATILALEGAGVSIPQIVPNSTVTFVVGGTVTGAPGTTVTNIATVAALGFTDPDTSDNQAQDADPVRGNVNLSIVKTNTTTTLIAGSTTSYLITVSNTGPAALVNGVLKDTPSAGLQCTSVTCLGASGPAICPGLASMTVANLIGPGIVIPSLSGSPASSLQFRVDCNVTATGQ